MSMPPHNEAKQQLAGKPSGPARLLIIEDEPLIRSSLAEFLEQEGFQVQTAANGPAGLQLVDRMAFDLVLTGCLFMGGLFFFGLFLFGRHDRSILYFALF